MIMMMMITIIIGRQCIACRVHFVNLLTVHCSLTHRPLSSLLWPLSTFAAIIIPPCPGVSLPPPPLPMQLLCFKYASCVLRISWAFFLPQRLAIAAAQWFLKLQTIYQLCLGQGDSLSSGPEALALPSPSRPLSGSVFFHPASASCSAFSLWAFIYLLLTCHCSFLLLCGFYARFLRFVLAICCCNRVSRHFLARVCMCGCLCVCVCNKLLLSPRCSMSSSSFWKDFALSSADHAERFITFIIIEAYLPLYLAPPTLAHSSAIVYDWKINHTPCLTPSQVNRPSPASLQKEMESPGKPLCFPRLSTSFCINFSPPPDTH